MNQIIEQVSEQGGLFNVSESKIYTGDEREIVGKKAIINADTGAALSVVSSGYRVLTNAEVFESFDKSLNASGIDLDGATVETLFTHNRARTMVKVTVPSVRVKVDGDETQAQIVALNSYDGKWKYSVSAGGIRLACLNGQVIGTIISHYSHYHTKNIDIQAPAERMVSMMQQFTGSQEWFEKMLSTKVTDGIAQRWIARFIKGYVVNDTEILETIIAGRIGSKLYEIWGQYKTEMGGNAYALYNAFTDYITHKEYRRNAAAGERKNQQKLERLITPRGIFALPERVTA